MGVEARESSGAGTGMTADPSGTGNDAAPTKIRHLVVLASVAMSAVLYLDRFCVNISERYIKEDLGLTETQVAWFISAFFWAYALAQVPAGFLGDRLAIRWVLAGYILLWSLFTGFIGLAQGAVMLLAMRLGCGLAQAGAYPLSGSLLRRWIPFQRRGFSSGLVALGGRVGAVIAPLLTGYLMVSFVPLSTPATLAGPQVLQPLSFAKKLVAGASAEKPTPASALWNQLDETDRQVLRQLTTDDPELASTPAAAEQVAGVVNHLIEHPQMFDPASMDRLSLSEEAVAFLKRQQAGETLSTAEQQRFHRLTLEAAFRDEVGKLYVRGWRPVLYVYGLAGVAVAVFFWLAFRDWPRQHPWCNVAEQRLIAGVAPHEPLPTTAPTSPAGATSSSGFSWQRAWDFWGPILKSPSLWLSSLTQFGTNVAWLFLLTGLPRYLIQVHDVPILTRSFMASLPPLAGIAGMFLGGSLTDWLTRRQGVRRGRAWPMGFTRFGIAAAYVACLFVKSPWVAIAFVSLAFFFVDLGVAAVWAFVQDVGEPHVASVLGWGNMWGNIGAAVAPILYNRILGESPTLREWNTLFLVCAGMAVVAGFAGLAIDATRPVFRAPSPPAGT